jgi:2-dehydro-3-deoxyglucarate aldolase
VPGIDAAFIGPYDLTASMGITAHFDHPDYLAALDAILNACQSHNVAPGIHIVPPDPAQAKARMVEGYRFLAYSLDITMVARACTEGLAALRI